MSVQNLLWVQQNYSMDWSLFHVIRDLCLVWVISLKGSPLPSMILFILFWIDEFSHFTDRLYKHTKTKIKWWCRLDKTNSPGFGPRSMETAYSICNWPSDYSTSKVWPEWSRSFTDLTLDRSLAASICFSNRSSYTVVSYDLMTPMATGNSGSDMRESI